MENEHTTRTSSSNARDVRSQQASGPPGSDTDPRHPDDPRGYNPQAPGHTRAPARKGIAGIAVVIGVILVTALVLFLIFGNGGLRDESAPASDPATTGTAPAGQDGTAAPAASDPAPAAPATDPDAPGGTADPAPAAPPAGD